jgi:hypothetical protein
VPKCVRHVSLRDTLCIYGMWYISLNKKERCRRTQGRTILVTVKEDPKFENFVSQKHNFSTKPLNVSSRGKFFSSLPDSSAMEGLYNLTSANNT